MLTNHASQFPTYPFLLCHALFKLSQIALPARRCCSWSLAILIPLSFYVSTAPPLLQHRMGAQGRRGSSRILIRLFRRGRGGIWKGMQGTGATRGGHNPPLRKRTWYHCWCLDRFHPVSQHTNTPRQRSKMSSYLLVACPVAAAQE